MAAAGTAGSLVLAFVTLTCFTLSGGVQRLAGKGSISLTSGASAGYWLALAVSFTGIVFYPALLLIGVGLPVLHVAGAWYLWLDLLLVGLAVCGSCYCIWKVFEAHPPASDLLTLLLSGKIEAAEVQPGVHALLQRICNATQLPMPDQVIYGLEANIDCTRRPVRLDGKPVRGLTRCELVPPALEAWIITHCSKWQVTRRGGAALCFVPLWHWMEYWDKYLSGTILLAMQRASVAAGRSSTAAAIAIQALTFKRWAVFELRARTRFRMGGELVNLSEGFALEVTRSSEELAASYLEVDESGVCRQALLTRLVHANPEDTRQRILAGPAGQASDCLAGFEQLEWDLSAEHLRRVR